MYQEKVRGLAEQLSEGDAKAAFEPLECLQRSKASTTGFLGEVMGLGVGEYRQRALHMSGRGK